MYSAFFRLQREPFSIAPDPRFLYMSEAHREALAHLLYGLAGGGGFVLLTGEIGAGKTTVCRCFLDQVPENCNVAYIFNPKLGVTELLRTICDEFHIALPPGARTVKDFVDALNAFLLEGHAAGRNSVLIIDEAQSLSAEVLEQLRLLTNLETAERKLLQIVLIGQPELRPMLARPELEQLAQRVIARYHLPALTLKETGQYVRHRLAVAGLEGEMPFETKALARLHELCNGVPRRINLLADRALLGGYASGKSRITVEIVDKAAAEVFGNVRRKKEHRLQTAVLSTLAVLGVVLTVLGGALAWQRQGKASAPAAAASAASAPLAAASAASSVAAAASQAAVQAAASAPAPAASQATPAAVLAASHASEAAAWRDLAAVWKLDLPPGSDPCEAAQRLQVACFKGTSGLAQLRQLGRPAVLTLRDGQGKPTWMTLTALGEQSATLAAGGTRQEVSLWTLAAVWRGEFATFWRVPQGFRETVADNPPAALRSWMSERLPGTPEQPLRARVVAFQTAQGLKPDGLVGPITLMQINRASGVDEPRLSP